MAANQRFRQSSVEGQARPEGRAGTPLGVLVLPWCGKVASIRDFELQEAGDAECDGYADLRAGGEGFQDRAQSGEDLGHDGSSFE